MFRLCSDVKWIARYALRRIGIERAQPLEASVYGSGGKPTVPCR